MTLKTYFKNNFKNADIYKKGLEISFLDPHQFSLRFFLKFLKASL